MKPDSLIPGLVVLKLASKSATQQDTDTSTNQQQPANFVRVAAYHKDTIPAVASRHDANRVQQLPSQPNHPEQHAEPAVERAQNPDKQQTQECNGDKPSCSKDATVVSKHSQLAASQITSRIPTLPIPGSKQACAGKSSKEAARAGKQEDRRSLQAHTVNGKGSVCGTAMTPSCSQHSNKFSQHFSSSYPVSQQGCSTSHHPANPNSPNSSSSSKPPSSPRRQHIHASGSPTPRRNTSSSYSSGLQLQPGLAALIGPGPVLCPAMQQHKDRRRAELYAINAILARSDALRVQEFLANRPQQQQKGSSSSCFSESSPQSQTSQLPGSMHHGV